VIDGIWFPVTVSTVEPTDQIRLLISLALFAVSGWALWKLWAPAKGQTQVDHDPVSEFFAASPSENVQAEEEQQQRRSEVLFDPAELAAQTQAWLDQDWFGTSSHSPVSQSPSSEQSSPEFAAETHSGQDRHHELEQHELDVSVTQAGVEQSDPQFSVRKDATPEDVPSMDTSDAVMSDVDTVALAVSDMAAITDDEADAPTGIWQDAAVAAVPSGRAARKLERRRRALAAKESSKVAKQTKRTTKAARASQLAVAAVLDGLNDESALAPFTTLPVRPPTKRETRRIVKQAAREVKRERRETRSAEAAQRAADKAARIADKAAAATAAAAKLQPAPSPAVPSPTAGGLAADTSNGGQAVKPALQPAPLAWEHAASLLRSAPLGPTAPLEAASAPDEISLPEPHISHRASSHPDRLWEEAAMATTADRGPGLEGMDPPSDAAESAQWPSASELVVDLWTQRLSPQGPGQTAGPRSGAPVDLPEPLPPRNRHGARSNR